MTVAVTPAGSPSTLTSTAPVKLPVRVTVALIVPVAPCSIVSVVAESETVKPGGVTGGFVVPPSPPPPQAATTNAVIACASARIRRRCGRKGIASPRMTEGMVSDTKKGRQTALS